MSTELAISIGALVLEVALLVFFYLQSRRPPELGRVRVFPYTPAIIFMAVLMLLTLAHIISLVTGTQVQPRRPKGMR
jgi:hypothetical protein